MSNRKLRLMMVDWIDSTTHTGWQDKEEFLKSRALLCRTVGFLVGDDDESLKMAASLSDFGNFADKSSIPKGCIIRRQALDVVLPKLERDKPRKVKKCKK